MCIHVLLYGMRSWPCLPCGVWVTLIDAGPYAVPRLIRTVKGSANRPHTNSHYLKGTLVYAVKNYIRCVAFMIRVQVVQASTTSQAAREDGTARPEDIAARTKGSTARVEGTREGADVPQEAVPDRTHADTVIGDSAGDIKETATLSDGPALVGETYTERRESNSPVQRAPMMCGGYKTIGPVSWYGGTIPAPCPISLPFMRCFLHTLRRYLRRVQCHCLLLRDVFVLHKLGKVTFCLF